MAPCSVAPESKGTRWIWWLVRDSAAYAAESTNRVVVAWHRKHLAQHHVPMPQFVPSKAVTGVTFCQPHLWPAAAGHTACCAVASVAREYSQCHCLDSPWSADRRWFAQIPMARTEPMLHSRLTSNAGEVSCYRTQGECVSGDHKSVGHACAKHGAVRCWCLQMEEAAELSTIVEPIHCNLPAQRLDDALPVGGGASPPLPVATAGVASIVIPRSTLHGRVTRKT